MNISPNRITGLASGMDTDSMVKQMMKPYNMKLDKIKQDRQTLAWKQELYRDIIGTVNKFKSSYFDVLKSDSYMLSKNTFTANSISGLTGTDVKVAANSNAKIGNYEIKVTNLAETASKTGTSALNTVTASAPNYGIKIDGSNNSFSVKLADNTTIGTVDLDVDSVKNYNSYSNLSQLASAINSKMSTTATLSDSSVKLSEKVKAVVKDNTIQFMELTKIIDDKTTPANSNNKIKFSNDGKDYEVTLAAGNYTADELAAQISSKLSGLKSTTDNTTVFPTGYNLIAETDTTVGQPAKFYVQKISDSTKVQTTLIDNKSVTLAPITLNVDAEGEGVGTAGVNTPSTTASTLSYDKKIIAGYNDTLNIRIGTDIKTITLAAGVVADDSALLTKITSALSSAVLQPDLTASAVSAADLSVSMENGKVKFTSTSGNQISVYGNAASVFGAYDNFEVNMSDSTLVSSLSMFQGNTVKFNVNNIAFEYDFSKDYDSTTAATGAKNKSISSIINEINTKAGVNISYSETTKKFTIESNATGKSSTITAADSGGSTDNFIQTLFGSNSINHTGEDATFELKTPSGTTTYAKATNNVTVDGLSITLNNETTDYVKFSINGNSNDAFNKVKGFVDKYNEMIDSINTKIAEKRQYKYTPLTDDQRESMSDDDIKLWEAKSKQGLLKSDPDLGNMLSSLRYAFFSPVKNAGITLQEIGIDTSNDYTQNGKIFLDETKFKAALIDKGEKISDLFAKKSTSYPSYSIATDQASRKVRYEEQGIFQRISDILLDYTKTTGSKGILLNKAGTRGDFSDITNSLTESIKQRDDMIKVMENKLFQRENRYYNQFAKLEKAMNSMNSQSSWLSQQLGTS